jgi:hypothetical protein
VWDKYIPGFCICFAHEVALRLALDRFDFVVVESGAFFSRWLIFVPIFYVGRNITSPFERIVE